MKVFNNLIFLFQVMSKKSIAKKIEIQGTKFIEFFKDFKDYIGNSIKMIHNFH